MTLIRPSYFVTLIYTALLLLVAAFPISFSLILSPYCSFTQFPPLSPLSLLYYLLLLSLHSALITVVSLFSAFFFSPVSSAPYFLFSSPPPILLLTFHIYPTPSRSRSNNSKLIESGRKLCSKACSLALHLRKHPPSVSR